MSPEGHAINLGEVMFVNKGSFSLFVTAEPHATVRQRSEMLIMGNALRKNTVGRVYLVNN